MDKGHAIREKSILLQDLITQPQRLEVEREQAKQYREKFHPGSTTNSGGGYEYGGAAPMSMGSSGGSGSQGYGGYGQKAADSGPGVMSVAAQGIGILAQGVGTVLSAGVSYIKGSEQQQQPGSKMPGFGSDSYSGGSVGGAYNPPAGGYSGFNNGSSNSSSIGYKGIGGGYDSESLKSG